MLCTSTRIFIPFQPDSSLSQRWTDRRVHVEADDGKSWVLGGAAGWEAGRLEALGYQEQEMANHVWGKATTRVIKIGEKSGDRREGALAKLCRSL